jgi:uncharacterized protein (TIRG00374 family)
LETCERRDGSPGWARWIARITFAVAVVAMVFTVWTVGPHTIEGHLRQIGWWFLAVIAFEALATVLDARAIHEFACAPDARFGPVLFAQIAGRAVNAVTPLGTLGEATKASLLARAMPSQRAVAAVLFYDYVNASITLVALALAGVFTALTVPLPDGVRIGLLAVAACAAATAIGIQIVVRRGILASLMALGVRLRLAPRRFNKSSRKKAETIDRLVVGVRGDPARRRSGLFVLLSKVTLWAQMWLILAAAGFHASTGQLAAILSGGVVVQWMASVVPFGAGVTEGGNYALFAALGAAPSFGVALALARRVNQILFAAVGFTLVAAWQMSSRAFALGRKLS